MYQFNLVLNITTQRLYTWIIFRLSNNTFQLFIRHIVRPSKHQRFSVPAVNFNPEPQLILGVKRGSRWKKSPKSLICQNIWTEPVHFTGAELKKDSLTTRQNFAVCFLVDIQRC